MIKTLKKINNHEFYNYSHKKYGVSPQGVRWNSKENQFIRFNTLIDFIQGDLPNSSLIDLGCGYGDLITYFQKISISPKKYIGLDCEKFMIDAAKERFAEFTFLEKNFLKEDLEECDYYICSGAFNTLTSNEIFKTIEQCFSCSNKGFVFNILTDAFIHNLNAFDILIHCQRLTKKVKFKSGYLEKDYTFFLEK